MAERFRSAGHDRIPLFRHQRLATLGKLPALSSCKLGFFETCGVRMWMGKKERGERLQGEVELQNAQGKDGEH